MKYFRLYLLRSYSLLLLLLSISVRVGVNSSRHCYPCNELHRTWKSDICINDASDCGECIHGFEAPSENPSTKCHFSGIVFSNQQVNIPRSSNITVNCHPTVEMFACAWKRNGEQVSMDDRHRYVNKNFQSSRDCSIKIDDFQESDFGLWQCNAYSQLSPSGPTEAKHFFMTSFKSHVILAKRFDVTRVPFGNLVIFLDCETGGYECNWTRNGDAVNMTDGDKYSKFQASDEQNTCCWFHVNDFQEEDVAKWRCHYDRLKVLSYDLTSVLPSLKIIGRPSNQVIQLGDKITLRCIFNYEVNCHWERNGLPVGIGGRYGYIISINGRETKDCSIKIEQSQAMDLGEWLCGNTPSGKDKILKSDSALVMVAPRVSVGEMDMPSEYLKMFVCSAMNGYPRPQILWKMNNTKQRENYSIQEGDLELYNFTSYIVVHLTEVDFLRCIVNHPSFPEPQIFDAQEMKQDESVLTSLIITEKAPNQIIQLGEVITLSCKFNYEVNCQWERNGLPVEIEDRYSYINSTDGKETNDCSIRIGQSQAMDLGYWKCTSMGSETRNVPTSHSALVMVKPTLRVVEADIPSKNLMKRFMCSASHGYPKGEIWWQMNGTKLTENYNVQLGDAGLYNITSYIDVHSNDVDSVKCVVHHPAFPEPQIFNVQGMEEVSSDNPLQVFHLLLGIGGAAVVLGIVGYIFYRRRCPRNGVSISPCGSSQVQPSQQQQNIPKCNYKSEGEEHRECLELENKGPSNEYCYDKLSMTTRNSAQCHHYDEIQ